MSKHVTGLLFCGLGAPSDGASSSGSAAAPAASADASYEPYQRGFPPEDNLFELGVFGVAIFPSSDHNLRYQVYPQRESVIGGELGARLGYFPLLFFGMEAEAMTAASKIKHTETSAAIYAGRVQAVLQAPLPYFSPFLLAGVGRLGAISRAMANDSDPAWHFGLGAKVPFTHPSERSVNVNTWAVNGGHSRARKVHGLDRATKRSSRSFRPWLRVEP